MVGRNDKLKRTHKQVSNKWLFYGPPQQPFSSDDTMRRRHSFPTNFACKIRNERTIQKWVTTHNKNNKAQVCMVTSVISVLYNDYISHCSALATEKDVELKIHLS